LRIEVTRASRGLSAIAELLVILFIRNIQLPLVRQLLQFIQLMLEIATVVCIIQNRVQLNVISVKLTYTITIKNVNVIYIKQEKERPSYATSYHAGRNTDIIRE